MFQMYGILGKIPIEIFSNFRKNIVKQRIKRYTCTIIICVQLIDVLTKRFEVFKMEVISNDNNRPSKYVCYKLSRVMRKVNRYFESNFSQFGITPAQFYVLTALWENEGVKFKDLAKSLEMDGSTLTSILDRMERQNFVERRDDPEDRRSLLVFLTEKAKQDIAVITTLAEKLNMEIKERFSEEEFATFVSVLERIAQD